MADSDALLLLSGHTSPMKISTYAARSAGGPLEAFDYDPAELPQDWVEVAVEHCGICHSDLSMLDNEWGRTRYPLVPGHEAVGRVVAAGRSVLRVAVGDRVGIGWYVASCMHCRHCIAGDQHLCASAKGTIVGHHGGFATRLRCHWAWATPLPAALDPARAGPLFCGGITVFSPIVEFGVRPTDRVAVVGIGGLGHLAVQFLAKWGCEVTALTSSTAKHDEARALGAHEVAVSTDEATLERLAGRFDFVLVTVNVPLPWSALTASLAPRGRLHFVGAVLEPIAVQAFALIGGRRSISGSPLGRPSTVADMLEFCARHGVAAQTEHFPLARVNDAIAHLRSGKARYRVVLDNERD